MNLKTLKFSSKLVEPILFGKKNRTWRLFDDKNLSVGDEVVLVNSETGEEFGRAVIDSVSLSTLGSMYEENPSDGHESYASREAMIEKFRGYYGNSVDADTGAKIIRFRLI